MKRCLLLYVCLWLAGSLLHAQQPERTVDFALTEKSPGVYRLEPQLPPLQPIPGAPAPFWRLFWELGDGNFSFEAEPTYAWPDTGTYEIHLWATGAYDNGRPPRDRPKHKRITKPRPSQYASAFPLQDVLTSDAPGLALMAVREPVPEEDLLFVLSYAGTEPQAVSGQLHLFFNEQAYQARHFDFVEARTHWGEQQIPPALAMRAVMLPQNGDAAWAALEVPLSQKADRLEALEALGEARQAFRDAVAWQFADLMPGERRNLFVVLHGTPQMLADTNATIHLRAVLTPDFGRPRVYDLEMSIATGHDPNRLSVRNPRRSYRRFRKQHFDWRIQFQNDGKGPAERVQLDFFVRGMDTSRVRVQDVSPALPPCSARIRQGCYTTRWLQEDHLQIVLHDIYLPGSRQPGVRHRDSTRGHVALRLWPDPHWPKRPLRARAEIVFDREPPIRTNRASVRFRPGLSPALVAGWRARAAGLKQSFPGTTQSAGEPAPYFSLGLTVAPFKPRRGHWQLELWGALPDEKSIEGSVQQLVHTDSIFSSGANAVIVRDSFVTTATVGTERQRFVTLVPLHLRYNLTSFLAVGMGAELRMQHTRITGQQTLTGFVNQRYYIYDPTNATWILESNQSEPPSTSTSPLDDRRRQWQLNPFADVQVLSVRHGPAVGLRTIYQQTEEGRAWRWMFYGQWRF